MKKHIRSRLCLLLALLVIPADMLRKLAIRRKERALGLRK